MLPTSNRLRRSGDFRRAVRGGHRAGRRTVVVHVLSAADGSGVARVGFIVNKAVGGAVRRNLVQRRLRAVMAAMLGDLPAGSLTVVRALPPAATASFDELTADVSAGLGKVLDAR